jgi:hypothetical protein
MEIDDDDEDDFIEDDEPKKKATKAKAKPAPKKAAAKSDAPKKPAVKKEKKAAKKEDGEDDDKPKKPAFEYVLLFHDRMSLTCAVGEPQRQPNRLDRKILAQRTYPRANQAVCKMSPLFLQVNWTVWVEMRR